MDRDPEPEAIQTSHPHPGITLITLNRPQARNAVDASTATKLYNAIFAFEGDSTAQIAILYGANGTFCAGFDLKTISSDAPSPNLDAPSLNAEERTQGPMGPSRLQIKKPLIAAVSGYAVAGGLEVSLLADLRVVEEDAIFGVFCRRWGVPLIDGGTVRLQAIVGLGRALDMILTGRPVSAQEALSMGLASRVVAKGEALQKALELAKGIQNFPQKCVNIDRASAYFAAYDAGSQGEALRFEYVNGVKAMEEGVVGAERFSKGAGRGGNFSKL